MKTERRHELQTNDLADWLGSRATLLRPYSKAIVGGLLIGAVLLAAVYFLRSQQAGRAAAAWTDYFEASGIAGLDQRLRVLREVANRYSQFEAGAWAWQLAAELDLALGSQEMTRDRAEARERLERARDAFQQALRITRQEMLRQRAHMGLAQTLEAMDEFDGAGKQYEHIIARWPGSAVANQAEDRLQFLRDPETREFYAWFIAQKPKPPARTPESSGGLTSPSIYDDLPDDPSLSLPAASDLQRGVSPSEPTLNPPETATEGPAEDAGEPAGTSGDVSAAATERPLGPPSSPPDSTANPDAPPDSDSP
jgi:tetratricopeptide (TPR) repeat protein